MKLSDETAAIFNFIHTLHSENTNESYILFRKNLRALENRDTVVLKTTASTIFVINYLINKKVSRQYENLVTAALKCIYEINEAILNWKKTKYFNSCFSILYFSLHS